MPDFTEETWVYLGRRWDYSEGKIYYVWRDPNGKELHYSKTRDSAVGGIYTAQVERTEDAIRLGSVTWTGETVGSDEKATLAARDAEAYKQKDWKAREKRAGTSPELESIAEAIGYICRDWSDISPVMSHLRTRVEKLVMQRERDKAKASAK